jgi:aryl-alcohol dehydrogenase-like predicted oxidoreductase
VEYRRLGRTDLTVSVIGVGSWQFSGEWGHEFTQAEVSTMLARARELGINLVDTAECYGDHLAEELIGAAIAGHRDEWVVATKFGHEFQADKVGGEQWWPQDARRDSYDPQQVVAQLDRSLKALDTDYVDIYQFHSGGAEHFATEGLWEAL